MFASKRGRRGNEIACIFVHAGAGFHSIQNEGVHLQACNEYVTLAWIADRHANLATVRQGRECKS